MAAVSEKNLPLDISVSFDPYAGEPGRDGEQFARPAPDGKVHFRIIAKDAKEVTVDRFGTLYPLAPAGDGAWEGTFDMGTGLDALYGNVGGIGANTGETAANTAAMRDALEYMEEDLAWMIDIAEREAIDRFTTAEISIDMGGVTNNIASEMDIDGVMDALADEILGHLEQYDPTA